MAEKKIINRNLKSREMQYIAFKSSRFHYYKNEGMDQNECAKLHKVSKATLKRHLNKGETSEMNKGRPTIFDHYLKNVLVQHVLKLEQHMFGLAITGIRKLAYQIAEKIL